VRLFRIQENVPDAYVRKSRDFQLFCNIFDCVNSAVKYDIDSIPNILSTKDITDKLLPLLQYKLGFITDIRMTNQQLRVILSGFCEALKYKGSRKGILRAIQLFLKMSNCDSGSKVYITNSANVYDASHLFGSYVVDVAIESELLDTRILSEILKFIIPSGYHIEYSFYNKSEFATPVLSKDKISINIVSTCVNDGIRPAYSSGDTTLDYLNTGASYFKLSGETPPNNWNDQYGEFYEYQTNKFVSVAPTYLAYSVAEQYGKTLVKPCDDGRYELVTNTDEFTPDNYKWKTLGKEVVVNSETKGLAEKGLYYQNKKAESTEYSPVIDGHEWSEDYIYLTLEDVEPEWPPVYVENEYYYKNFNFINVGGVSTTSVLSFDGTSSIKNVVNNSNYTVTDDNTVTIRKLDLWEV
jgi:hypothetical protein